MAPPILGDDILAVAGGVALLYLSVLLLRLGRRVSPATVLGLFALFWGAQVILLRVFILVRDFNGNESSARLLLFTSLGFALPLYLLLGHFTAVFPRRLAITKRRWWSATLAVPAVVFLFALAFSGGAGVAGSGGPSLWGWGVVAFAGVPLMVVLAIGLARFSWAYLSSSRGHSSLRYATLALLVYDSSFFAGFQVFVDFGRYAQQVSLPVAALSLVAMVGGTSVTVAVASRLVLRDRAHRRVWIAAAVVPAVTTLLIGGNPFFLGFWRFCMVGLLTYAIAKHHLFDADLRLRRNARWAACAGVALVSWGALTFLLETSLPGAPEASILAVAAATGALVGATAWRPLGRFINQQFPYIRASEEYLLRRRIEVYRAAAEGGTSASQLDALARELRLRPEQRLILDRGFGDGHRTAKAAVLAGRYAIVQTIAPGVFGRVLLAKDQRLGDDVVLKEFRGFAGAAASSSFAREAKTLGDLEHPNIVRVRDVFRAGDDMFVVTEHANGGNLDDRLTRSGPLAEDEALRIAEQVLAGLAKAHKRGIVHRDVKPSNILFHRGEARLCDFGVALDPVLDGALRAAKGQVGTLGWMAPEQARGDGATPASDVYSVGAVLYRMLAGRHYVALDGLGEQAARRSILEQGPALPLSGVSPATNALLARALEKDPRQRYEGASAMLADVRRAKRAAAQTAQENPQPYGALHAS